MAEHCREGPIGDADPAVSIGLEDPGQVAFKEGAVALRALEQSCIGALSVMLFSAFQEIPMPAGQGDECDQDDADGQRIPPQPLEAKVEILEFVVFAQQLDLALPLAGFERGLKLGEIGTDL